MKNKGKKILSLVLALLMILGLALPTGVLAPRAEAAEGDTPAPAHSKSVTSNEDGTYTIELTVTGDADTKVQTAANVNVLIVYDVSQSMTTNVTGTNRSRADYAEDIMHDFITGLQGYQNSSDPSNIQVALVTFGPDASTRQSWTSDLSGGNSGINRFFDDGVDGTVINSYGSNYGTNWEGALIQAESVLGDLHDTDPTFVIFVTDGVCTKSGTASGNGDSPTNTRWSHYSGYYNAAADNAFSIEQRDNTTLFGIYAYGSEADLLDDMIYFAITPNEDGTAGTHRTMTVDGTTRSIMDIPDSGNLYQTYNFGATTETDNYFNAVDTAALNSAIESIFQKIVQALGVSSVGITDGTTNKVTVGTEPVELLEVDETSYQYWLSIPIVNYQFQRIDLVSGETVTYTVINDGKTVTWPGGSVEVNGTISGGQLKYQWTGANLLYNIAPPSARLIDGKVIWNLDDVGTLLDGVTYSVTFKCYASQTTLDYVADIMNDPYVDEDHPGAWGKLDPTIQQYIDKNGGLLTNTTASLTWIDTRETNPELHDEEFTDELEPVSNDAVETLSVSKEWKNLLEDEWNKPASLTLRVARDGDPHYPVILNDENDWENSVFISLGIMGADGKPLAGAEGHDFTFIEPDGVGYHWEIDVPTVHPMLINNEKTMLIKVDDKHPAPEGAMKYTFKDYLGVESTYYVGDAAVALTATNERRSSINLVKKVNGEDAPEDATFRFTLNVVDSLAPTNAPTAEEDPNLDSDYWIWISIWDKDQHNVEEGAVVSGATHAGGSWYYGVSGEDIVLDVKDGYSIRINNLPTGTSYTITESDIPEGFAFEKTEKELIQGEGEWAFNLGQETTGKVDTTNAIYTITYNNKYEHVDINVDKVWEDNSDQDGLRPKTLELTLNVPSGVTVTVPEPKISISEDKNTWTYVWESLPRYDTDGNEIKYTVTETNIPSGYTCANSKDVEDEGTITNVHAVAKIDVTVTKEWSDADNQDGIRPAKVEVTLLADGAIVQQDGITASVTLGEDNKWTYTWTGLDQKKSGKDIVYTVEETKTKIISGEDGSGTYAIAVAPTAGATNGNAFTVTNTHTPEKTSIFVEKNWIGPAADDGATINLMNGQTIVATITLPADGSNTYEFTGLDKYASGQEIKYTVAENPLDGYITSGPTGTGTKEDPFVFTNINDERISVYAQKNWDDADNQDGIRPKSISFQLKVGSENVGDPVSVGDQEKWIAVWTNLNKYDSKTGNEIVYTVTEIPVDNYTLSESSPTGTGTEEDPFIFTNSYTPGTTSVMVSKEWNDADDQDGIRPAKVEVTLLADGAPVQQDGITASITLGEDNRWTYTWTGLNQKKNGQDIVYTVEETKTKVISGEDGPGTYAIAIAPTEGATNGNAFTVTNTHTPETIELTVIKVWEDDDDQAGMRPDSLAVTLNDENKTTVTLSADGKWTATVQGLPKYSQGEPIEYAWTEEETDGYEQTGVETKDNITTITNTLVTGSLTITKTFEGLPEGAVPEKLTFNISCAENQYSVDVTYAEFEDGECTIDNLPVGTYTVAESGYEYPDYTLTANSPTKQDVDVKKGETAEVAFANAYTQDAGSLKITKTITGLPEGAAPEKLTFTVTDANGRAVKTVVYASDFRNGECIINGLPVGTYTVAESGYEYQDYTLAENTATTAKVSVEKGKETEVAFTNAYTQDTGSLTITKTFEGLPEGVVPEKLTFAVTDANGREVKSVAYADFQNGEYTVTLPVGTYTIAESGYEYQDYTLDANSPTKQDIVVKKGETAAAKFTNAYTQDTGSLKITKTITGLPEGAVPEKLTFTVTDANGREVKSIAYADFQNGEYTVTLPVGTYTIAESGADYPDYFLIQGTETSKTAAVEKGKTATAAFTNEYDYGGIGGGGDVNVYYDGNGGTGTVVDKNNPYGEGTDITLLPNGFTYPGHDFVGWSLDPADASAKQYNPGDIYTLNFDTTFYALWVETPVEEPAIARLRIIKTAEGGTVPDTTEFLITGTPTDVHETFDPVTVTYAQIKDGTYLLTVPVGTYTVTEKKESAALPGFILRVTGDNGVAKALSKHVTVTFNIKNTYMMEYVPEPPPVEPPALNKKDHFAYIIGDNNGMVLPNDPITRAEVATIFFRLLTDESRDQLWTQFNGFSDVELEQWFNNAVSTMARGGIIVGYPDGTFRPNASITRAEFATMAVRFFRDNGIAVPRFSDVEGHWAEQYINMAAEKGLIVGYPDGTFRPDAPITRAEAMTIINRLLERHPHKDRLLPNMIQWPDNLNTAAWYYADVQEATNSHTYVLESDGFENWEALLPVRDWAAFEKVWSTAHSAPNPGDVVNEDRYENYVPILDKGDDQNEPAPNDGQQTDGQNEPAPNDGQQTDGQNEPAPNDGQQTDGQNEPAPNDGQQTNGQNEPAPNNGQQNDSPVAGSEGKNDEGFNPDGSPANDNGNGEKSDTGADAVN